MGKLIVPETELTTIQAPDSGSLTVGLTTFPTSDSSYRSIASFGESESFNTKSTYQQITTATATILDGTNVIGVLFNGPVVLTLPSSTTNLNEIFIVDEGGFASSTNTITISSPGAVGSLVISSPYSYIKTRNNGNIWISETRETIQDEVVETPEFLNEPGTTTTTSADGRIISTSADGNTTYTVFPDGTTELSVRDGAITSTTTISPDGTIVEAMSSNDGSSSSFTTLPDGSTIQQTTPNDGSSFTFTTNADGSTIEQNNPNDGSSSTFIVAADGTTTDLQFSNSGNELSIITSPDGTVETVITRNDGSSETSTVNSDGSSTSFERANNGRITTVDVDTDGVEVVSVYYPWQSFYTVTTTPPGTSETFSPNPFQF